MKGMRSLVRALLAISVVFGVLLAAAPALAAQPDTQGTVPLPDSFVYVVLPGDTLARIAARFGVTVSEVQTLNGISNPNRIYAGQRLLIPRHVPTPPPPGGPARLQFKPGATSAQVSGNLVAGEVRSYIVRASQGQIMIANVDSPSNGAWLGISGMTDGRPLLRIAMGMTQWHGALPLTQDYMVSVAARGGDTSFTLQVAIPVKVQFAPGAISRVLTGNVAAGMTNSYTLRARGGQTMHIEIVSPRSDVLLTIWGLEDGQPLVRYITGATSWIGVLPGTQDYVIEARATGGATGYTLNTAVW